MARSQPICPEKKMKKGDLPTSPTDPLQDEVELRHAEDLLKGDGPLHKQDSCLWGRPSPAKRPATYFNHGMSHLKVEALALCLVLV
jgi:hypothetical protein